MVANQSPQRGSKPHSTLEVWSPTYSTLELDQNISHFSTSPEVCGFEHNATPYPAAYGNEHSTTWQSNATQDVEGQEKPPRGKMILGVSVIWFLVFIAVVVVSVAGGVAGGVLGSKSSSTASKGEVSGDKNSPASTVIIATTPVTTSLDTVTTSTSSFFISSTLTASTSTQPSAAVETLFEMGKYYNILNNFVLSNGKVSALRSNVSDAVWNNALGLEERSASSARQQWTFEPVPASWPNASISNFNFNEKTELVAAYWIYNLKFGRQRLYVNAETKNIEQRVELALLFGPEDNADKQQYWYITRSLDDPSYYELRNWKSGNLWALTAHELW